MYVLSAWTCSSLPPEPPNQNATGVPWGGTILMDMDPAVRNGKKCLGLNFPEERFQYAESCPQIGVRTYNYEERTWDSWAYMWVDFEIRGPAPNDTIWLNITSSRRLHETNGKLVFPLC